jgi:hypothetical protein
MVPRGGLMSAGGQLPWPLSQRAGFVLPSVTSPFRVIHVINVGSSALLSNVGRCYNKESCTPVVTLCRQIVTLRVCCRAEAGSGAARRAW